MIKVFYDKDINSEILKERKIAIIGFGNQGAAQAMNLIDSDMDVVVGELKNSPAWKNAKKEKIRVMSASEAAKYADYIVILVPDEIQLRVYKEEIEPYLTAGKVLGFDHGFSIHFHQIIPPKDIDIVMAAPKAPGASVRKLYKEGQAAPALACVEQDYSGKAWDLVLAYCKAQRWTRAGIIKSTFKDETETDLFGEQAIIVGGVAELVKAGFEIAIEAGYPPEIAFFETFHELKLVVDIMYEGGIPYMYKMVSNTAKYGSLTRGKLVINEESRKAMKKILKDIQDGTFITEWLLQNKIGCPKLKALLKLEGQHPIEELGQEIRKMMPWLRQEKN